MPTFQLGSSQSCFITIPVCWWVFERVLFIINLSDGSISFHHFQALGVSTTANAMMEPQVEKLFTNRRHGSWRPSQTLPRSKPRLSTKRWVFNDLWNPHEALRMCLPMISRNKCFKGDLPVEKSVKIAMVMQPIMMASHLHGTIHTSKAHRHEAERTPIAANESFRTRCVRI